MTAFPTLLHAFFHNAQVRSERPALRYKDGGSWHDINWARYRHRVLRLAAGLREAGVGPGDLVGILCTNRVEWLVYDLAAMTIGAGTVPIYPSSIPIQVKYILEHSASKSVLVEDTEQLAKVLEVRDALPALSTLVLVTGEITRDIDGLVSFEELEARGEATGVANLAEIEAGVLELDPDSLATIVYTSGTTGPPKGAMLSHRNVMAMGDSLIAVVDGSETDSSLSFLPLSHIAERLQGEIMAIRVGYAVNLGEGIPAVAENLVEVEPTLLVCVPRLWEKYYARITSGLQDAPPLRRKLFDWAAGVGTEVQNHRAKAGSDALPYGLKLRYEVADRLVLSKLRNRLGMGRTRTFLSGAAPLSAEVGRFFASVGIVIQEVYGQTECTGVCTYNPRDRPKFGTVGIACPNMDVKIADDGEILVRGDNVFMGYRGQPEATAEAIVDGWLLTGDVGEIDSDGYVKITDRKKDIIVTAGGKNVSPQNIENRLKTGPGISQVVVIGDKRKYLSALITLDLEALEEVFERNEWKLPSSSAVPDDERVRALLQGYIDGVNHDLASYETVKKFKVLPEDFTVESGELTPSLKVKRRVIQKRYEDTIDAFYSEKFV